MNRISTRIPVLCVLAGACAPASPAPRVAREDTVRGMFHTVWSSGDAAYRFFVTDSAGRTFNLQLGDSVFAAAGGLAVLDRRAVRVIGRALDPRTVRVVRLEPLP